MHLRFLIAPISATILLWSTHASAVVAASPCNNGAGCGLNETCEIVGGSAGGCDPSAVCDPIVTNIYGCVPQPITCMVTSECPFPLTCVSNGGDSTGTGTGGSTGSASTDPAAPPGMTDLIAPPIMDPPVSPGPVSKTCTYEPQTCTTSADCGDPRFDCMEIGRTEVCGGVVEPDNGGSGGATGAGTSRPASTGAALPPSGDVPVSSQEPPVCEVQEIVRACFPKTVACKTAADCKDGWSCYDFSTQTAAPFYNAALPNLYCMPPGLVLVLDGQVGVNGGDAFSEGGAVGGGPPRTTVQKGGIEESSGGPKAELSNGGGCSTAGRLANASGLWTLLALAGAMIFSRRSRR